MHIERHSTYDKFFYKTRSVPVNGKGPLILLVVLVLAVSFFLFQRVTNHFMAEANCATVRNSTLNRDKKPPLWEIKRAIDHDSSNAEYHHKLARYYMRLPVKSKDLKSKINEEIIKNLEKAVSLNPVNGRYWYDLGLRYSYKGYEGNEYLTKWLPVADAAFERAIYFRPHDAYLLHNIGRYWVWRSSTLPEAEDESSPVKYASPFTGQARLKAIGPPYFWRAKGSRQGSVVSGQWSREEGIDKFQGLFRRSLEIDKKYWKKAVERVWKYYPDERIVMGIIPEGDEDLGGRAKKWLGLRR
jgi:tetratricopeptide (TPR) repeat protein